MGKPSVVLFPHPGAELDSTRRGELYPWTRKNESHRRKFLRAEVRAAVREGGAWRIGDRSNSAAMWTEYEPPTRIRAFEDGESPGLPNAWHEFVPVGGVPSAAHGAISRRARRGPGA